MTEAHSKRKNWQRTRHLPVFVIPVAVLLVSVVSTTASSAQAMLIPLQEHWKYNVRWDWDPDHFRTIGYIDPKIVIQNETNDKIAGYIADQNGTRLSMYNEDQYVQVKYTYSNGFVTKWELGSKLEKGYFTIEIPEAYRNADIVSIYIGNNEYTVDDGTPYTPQTPVFINSARADYQRNVTMMATTSASTTTTTNSAVTDDSYIPQANTAMTNSTFKGPSPGSLIDLILSRLGMLPTSTPISTTTNSNSTR